MLRISKDSWIRANNPIYFDSVSQDSDCEVQADFLRLKEEIEKLKKALKIKQDTLEITIQELQCRGLLDYDPR